MSTSAKELIAQLRTKIPELSVEQAKEKVESGVKIIDVREADEFRQGHIPGARFIPRGFLELKIEDFASDRDEEILLYCAGGSRSLFAAQNLTQMGYRNVSSLRGGFTRWKDSGHPVVIPEVLTESQRKRYDRRQQSRPIPKS